MSNGTLNDVYEGVQVGKHFRRRLDNDEGYEYVRPTNSRFYFVHTVAGQSNGGWGGQAELSIETLKNGRWAEFGWEDET